MRVTRLCPPANTFASSLEDSRVSASFTVDGA